MLQGYKSYIGVGIWAVGAVIIEFFSGTGIAGYGQPLMDFGKLIFAGGMAAKAARFLKANSIR